ncbi:tetratricopeptide repeat protein [Stieleria sp. ICT_E10.1]|uniref:tetratricopeptide repeat protein n=1 Tax=Stieleria sedimenti TaxID=2976331 RepID=UPI00217FE1F4|nr:tetratricopeptide repeat protein [Stieleria sedimenti]MCS7468467.1 tetratricopeptide repeat protein [Stieleria sedimenti]
MKRMKCKTLGFALLGILTMLIDVTPRATAELLPADQLASCQLHVIGIYSPESSADDRVFVDVQPTGKPVVLVLTGYYGAQWNLDIAAEADVRQIIVAGYFEHSVRGVPDRVPTERITYYPSADKTRKDFFWAYSWHTKNGRDLRSRLKQLTGLEVTTFQGEYSAKRFVVDGKNGDVTQFLTAEPPPSAPAGNANSLEQKLREHGSAAKSKLLELSNQFGQDHPAVKQLEKSLDLIDAQLKRLGAAPLGPTAKQPSTAKPPLETDPNKVIEALVRQSFQLQMQLQLARVEKAEADLQRVKLQLQQRLDSAEEIIAARVQELINRDVAEPETKEQVPASVLTDEGWKAWRTHDTRKALTSFLAAIKIEPENQSARNGLGWTYVHLGEYDKAITEFKKIDPDSPVQGAALNGIGQSLLALGKLDEAEKVLLDATEDMIAKDGEAGAAKMGLAAWYGLVRTYLQQKNYEQAKQWSRRYLKHKPDDKGMKDMLEQAESESDVEE